MLCLQQAQEALAVNKDQLKGTSQAKPRRCGKLQFYTFALPLGGETLQRINSCCRKGTRLNPSTVLHEHLNAQHRVKSEESI